MMFGEWPSQKFSRMEKVKFLANIESKGAEVFVNRVGNAIILLPVNDPWKGFLESLGNFSDDFMTDREQGDIEERQPL